MLRKARMSVSWSSRALWPLHDLGPLFGTPNHRLKGGAQGVDFSSTQQGSLGSYWPFRKSAVDGTVVIFLWNGQLGNPRKHQAAEPFVTKLTPYTGIKLAERDSTGRVFSATLASTKRISVVQERHGIPPPLLLHPCPSSVVAIICSSHRKYICWTSQYKDTSGLCPHPSKL